MKRFCLLILLSLSIFSLEYGDIVFNELMWMGTSISGFDEYIELRNMTGDNIDFSDNNLSVLFEDSLMFIIDDGSIPPWGLFVISRLSSEVSQMSYEPDFIEPELFLPNTGSCYNLYSGSTLLDRADNCIGQMAAGRYVTSSRWWSMERNNPPGDGTLDDSWHHGCLQVNWNPGARERGTPGATNYKNIPPTPPDSLMLSDRHPADDDEITCFAYGVRDYDDLPLPVKCFFDWYRNDEFQYTDVDSVGPTYESTLSSVLTEPGDLWHARIMLYDDVDSVGHFLSDTALVHWQEGDLIVSEIMWMGSSRYPRGEWIEIANMSGKDMDFLRTPVTIFSSNAYGYPKRLATLKGVLPSDSLMVIAGSSIGSCRLAEEPDTIIFSFDIPDLHVGFTIFDGMDTLQSALLDRAGDYGRPLSGRKSTIDSIYWSMSRNIPPSDGRFPEAWHSSPYTMGFFGDEAIERGTPGYHNPMGNSSPILEEAGYLFSPDFGNRDTVFRFQVIYSDADGTPPEYVRIKADFDGDGAIDDYRSMYPIGDDYVSGVLYRADIDSIFPQKDMPFSFHASDGYVRTVLGIPPYLGPDIELTAGLSVSDIIWYPDTIYDTESVIGPGWKVINTGDIPQRLGLEIALDDSIEYREWRDEVTGGLLAVESPTLVGINKYCISGLFQNNSLTPIFSQFNTSGNEDVLTTDKRFADSVAFVDEWTPTGYILQPNDSVWLYFRFDPPLLTFGPYRWRPHIISLRLWYTPYLE